MEPLIFVRGTCSHHRVLETRQMDFLKSLASFENAMHLVSSLVIHGLPLLLFPILLRIMKHNREQKAMVQKKLFENTGVMLFGEFGGQVQSEFLGNFLTTLFGESIFDLVVGWNDQPSPNVIVPETTHQAAHLAEIMSAKASEYILQTNNVDCYFDGAELHGNDKYRYCKIIVALARPDAQKLASYDYARLIAIEVGALMRVVRGAETKPQHETTDGFTWLEVVKELGHKYTSGQHQGLAVLEFPMNDILRKQGKRT